MKCSVLFTAALTLLVLCFSHSAIRADDVPEFELTPVGSCMHSEIGASAIRGDYAYSVTPHGLLVIDISDPANPIPISETFIRNRIYRDGLEMLPDIALRGNVAYIAGLRFLTAMDISNPRAPYIISTCAYTDDPYNWQNDMALSGDRLYLCNDSGLIVFDISDPGNMVPIGQYHQIKCNGLDAKDSLIYLITSYDGLIVLNASNPAAISELKRYDLNGARIEVVDTLAFAISGGLVIMNISDPLNAIEISRSSLGDCNGPVSLRIDNDLAYIGCPWNTSVGPSVIDISDILSPVLISTFPPYYGNSDIDLKDSLVFLSGFVYGLTVFNMANPTQPNLIGQYAPPYFGDRMAIDGNYAYGVVGPRLQVVDFSRPQDPYFAAQCVVNNTLTDLVICDTLIYMTAVNGLYVVNINDPKSPIVVDSFVADSFWWGRVTADENYIYWAGSGFRILDRFANSPISVVGYLSANSYSDIAVNGGYAYIFGSSKLIEIDISDPTAPQLVEYQPSYYLFYWDEVNASVIRWPYLYAVGRSSSMTPRFVVFDVEDPYDPVLDTVIYRAGNYDVGSSDIVLAGDSAYVLSQGIFPQTQIFSLSDPEKPQFVAESDFGGSDFEIVGNTFYFGSREYFLIATTSAVTCGDINGDGTIDTGDIIWLISYIFRGGPAPIHTGDVDNSGGVNIADVVYMINYLFGNGPQPVCP